MDWLSNTLDALESQPVIGYAAGSAPASEPTALAALALAADEKSDAARQAADWLAELQAADGSVGVRAGESTPGWPTSLAIVAWSVVNRRQYNDQIERAVAWLLANRGCPIERSPDFGHNTELVGWPYAKPTHSWVEPTALAVLALKAASLSQHPATREGVTVLIDRQLPGGGLNYGNTFVLGQLIRPHVHPTGLALVALAGPGEASARVTKSISWLRRRVGPQTTPLSLGWALLGLHAHGQKVPTDDEWMAAAAKRVTERDKSPHKLAMLALATKGWPA